MSATTSVWNVEAGTEWRIWRSWCRAAEHLDMVRRTCVMCPHRQVAIQVYSKVADMTYIAGVIGTSSINMADTGSWCSRRLVVVVVSSSSPRGKLLRSWHLFHLASAQRGQTEETSCLGNRWKVWLPGCLSHIIIPDMVDWWYHLIPNKQPFTSL